MIVSGTALAHEIKTELREELEGKNLTLAVVVVGDDPVSARYVQRKEDYGVTIGVEVQVFSFEETITTDELSEEVVRLARRADIAGLIVQLPLPGSIDRDQVLSAIPADKDVDALTAEARVDSPVARAVAEILARHNVPLEGARAVVVGQGALVGRPVALWLAREGAEVSVVDKDTPDIKSALLEADIIVSGVGQAGLITPDMLRTGVVLIDAGTSESNGTLMGDADPACADKCSLFTPVPGGVGPVTMAMLFKNLAYLANS